MLRGEVESNLNKKFVRVSEVLSMFGIVCIWWLNDMIKRVREFLMSNNSIISV